MRTGCDFRPNTERILGLFSRNLKTTSARGDVIASLLELQDVALLGSEISGLGGLVDVRTWSSKEGVSPNESLKYWTDPNRQVKLSLIFGAIFSAKIEEKDRCTRAEFYGSV